MHEKCGVAAVIDLEGRQNVVPLTVALLQELQHRGQMGTGIAWKRMQKVRGNILGVFKDIGLVADVLTPERLRHVNAESSAAIGHTRYATSARGETNMFCHPYHYPASENQQEFAMAFNGNIPDYSLQLEMLREAGIEANPEGGDTEMIGQMIVRSLRQNVRGGMRAAIQDGLRTLDGACNAVVLSEKGKIFASRDPLGFNPLTYAQRDSLVAVASEDSAIRTIWPHAKIEHVAPGDLLRVNKNGASVTHAWDANNFAMDHESQISSSCFLQWVYFANHRTHIDKISVANARYACGKELALRDMGRPDTDIVMPMPESAKIAANGYSDTRRLRRVDGILRRHGAGRTFIEGEEGRDAKILAKFDIDPELIRGKNIILIDDSMVRGKTMRIVIRELRKMGVGQIHVRLACPPILAPCFYGIDFDNTKQLIASKYHHTTLDEFDTLPPDVLAAIALDIGADSVEYLPVSAVSNAIGVPRTQLCMACVTGEYPTRDGNRLYQLIDRTRQ